VLLFSAASIWEIAIKSKQGRDSFEIDPNFFQHHLRANGYEELPITAQHAAATHSLPALHGDPFDRLLVAQAISEGLLLLTSDRRLSEYPGPIERV
jgi:PIN domain nuclease of toxin-antitoxin system